MNKREREKKKNEKERENSLLKRQKMALNLQRDVH